MTRKQSEFDEKRAWQVPIIATYIRQSLTLNMLVQDGPIGTSFRRDKSLVETRSAAKIDRHRLKRNNSLARGDFVIYGIYLFNDNRHGTTADNFLVCSPRSKTR
jgi:hypothetical protein